MNKWIVPVVAVAVTSGIFPVPLFSLSSWYLSASPIFAYSWLTLKIAHIVWSWGHHVVVLRANRGSSKRRDISSLRIGEEDRGSPQRGALSLQQYAVTVWQIRHASDKVMIPSPWLLVPTAGEGLRKLTSPRACAMKLDAWCSRNQHGLLFFSRVR